jgi:hypothetical protein
MHWRYHAPENKKTPPADESKPFSQTAEHGQEIARRAPQAVLSKKILRALSSGDTARVVEMRLVQRFEFRVPCLELWGYTILDRGAELRTRNSTPALPGDRVAVGVSRLLAFSMTRAEATLSTSQTDQIR